MLGISKQYEKTMKRKMAQYHRNGIKFISIYPDNLSNLDWIFRAKFRDLVGYDLPRGTRYTTPNKYCASCGASVRAGARFCESCGKRIP